MLSTGLSVWYMVFCGYRSSSSLSAISCTNLTSKNLKLPNDISLHFTKCLNPVCWPLTLFSVFILQTYIRSSNELCFFSSGCGSRESFPFCGRLSCIRHRCCFNCSFQLLHSILRILCISWNLHLFKQHHFARI